MTDFLIIREPAVTVVHSRPVGVNTVILAGLGLQGPPGIAGTTGAALQLIAGMALGGNRVVTGAAQYADSSDLATAGRAIGITQGAASLGAPVNIVASGELDGFFGLIVDQPAFVAANGTVSQSLPGSGYLQSLGVAVSASRLLINISPPLILG